MAEVYPCPPLEHIIRFGVRDAAVLVAARLIIIRGQRGISTSWLAIEGWDMRPREG